MVDFENKKRRVTILCLFSFFGYRQVTILPNKQEQFTPIKREPSELLALGSEFWRYSRMREQEPKTHVSKKNERGDALFIGLMISKNVSPWKGLRCALPLDFPNV